MVPEPSIAHEPNPGLAAVERNAPEMLDDFGVAVLGEAGLEVREAMRPEQQTRRLDGGDVDHHQRISEAPQVKPPPIASIITRWPRWMRPSRTASVSASGTEAADVLAWRSTVITTFS